MVRKRLLGVFLVLVILSFGLLMSPVACEKSSIAGKYVNQNSPTDYLDLKSNGTYYLWEDGMSLEGGWKVSGDKITLTWMGFEATGTIEGNKFVDDDGEVWVKR